MRSRMVFNYGTELSDALIQGGNAILGGVFSEIDGGKNYFMFAKDMRRWFHKIWGAPRVYKCNPRISLKNGIVAQYGFGSQVTGHVEYFYKGRNGYSARSYYEDGIELKTELWKCGIR